MEIEEKIEKKEKKLKDFINAIYQNLQTALQSIDEILKVCKDDKLMLELKREEDEYKKLKDEVLDVSLKIAVSPQDNNLLEKARLWSSIKFTTMTDKSTRHLTEMMLLGTVMGTTTCYKDLCDYKNVNDSLYNLLNKLIKLEEENFNALKKFLKEVK